MFVKVLVLIANLGFVLLTDGMNINLGIDYLSCIV